LKKKDVDGPDKPGHDERWRWWVIAVAFLFIALATPALAQDAPKRSANELMDAVMWGKEPIGGPFRLTDQEGRIRTEADFRGKLLLVYFGFTYCPDICPTDLQAMGLALDQLGAAAEAVQPLFITLDPARDTREHLADYVKLFHPRMLGLTGEQRAIDAAAAAYRVHHARVATQDGSDYTIDHSAFVYLMGRNGEFLGFFPPGTAPERMAAAIRPQLSTR
jgi:cytochrome oxidase Cu insertion factor (SCO1/SenC/PrrC family)